MTRFIVFMFALLTIDAAHAESYAVLCPENYYIVDEHCEPCPTGYINPAGSNTECIKKCADGEYYVDYPWQPKTCVVCPTGYPYSDPDATSESQCYSDTKMRPYDGTVTCRKMPTGCTSAICTVCESEPAPCEYIEYSDGTVKSGCAANPCLSDIVDDANGGSGIVYDPESGICEPCAPGTYLLFDWNLLKELCTPCAAGTYNQNAGATDATACTTCPAGTYSDAGAATCTPCAPGTYSDATGATECTPCADGMTSGVGATQCVAAVCDAGYYGNGTTCTKCPDEYPYSDIGATEFTNCYSDTKLREWTGEQTETLPTGCAGATYGECKINACEYVAYCSKFPWDSEYNDGVIKSGCATNNANCVKLILSVTANPGYIVNGIACTQCPAGTYSSGGNTTKCIQCPKNTYSAAGASECTPCPDDYPNSEPGATANTQCYSNEKERPWTGHQVCNAPTNCIGVACTPCEIKPCTYVAYNNRVFPWDPPMVKSGCTANNANCATPVRSATAAPGWHTVGTSRCEICPAGTYGPGGENAQCTTCPANKKTSPAGSTSEKYCGRILNYQKPGDTSPTQIYLNGIRNTSPSFNVKIGDDIFYANMTPVTNTTTPGMYVNYDNQTYIVTGSDTPSGHAAAFTITTTDNTTMFNFKLSASGVFTVDWGDGTNEQITHANTATTELSHSYATAGAYKIEFYGVASGYSTTDAAIIFLVPGQFPWDPVAAAQIAQISGSLGKIFPTIGDGGAGHQPLFTNTFNGATNLTGEIPAELFAGIGGTPAPQMFMNTFNGCSGLTGLSPRMADGTPLYTWASSVENACPTDGCNTFAGATGLSDYDEIPDAFK